MPEPAGHTGLEAELRQLGRDLEHGWPGTEITASVLDRLGPPPDPARPGPRAWLRRRRYTLAAALLALTVGIGANTPVGASVARWLGFGGVAVERPAETPSSLPTGVPSAGSGPSFDQAAGLVAFVPAEAHGLGVPSGIEVSADRRVLSMSWQGDDGPVRLDQFDGELSWVWLKRSMPEDLRFARVGAHEAVWFEQPHPLTYLDAEGREHTAESRMAARTLVWVVDGVTRRLEGDLSLSRAVEIARAIN